MLAVTSGKKEKTSATLVSGTMATIHGVAWNATSHHAKYAKQNLIFVKQSLTSVKHAYFRHANAVLHDLAARNIETQLKIEKSGLAANAGKRRRLLLALAVFAWSFAVASRE